MPSVVKGLYFLAKRQKSLPQRTQSLTEEMLQRNPKGLEWREQDGPARLISSQATLEEAACRELLLQNDLLLEHQ